MSFEDGIRTSSASPIPYGINFMLYADPGWGKTPFIADRDRTLILDADLGAESATGLPAHIRPIRVWSELEEAYEWLRDGGLSKYDWVWLDGISVGQQRLLTGIMDDLVAAKPHRKRWQADKGEYGENMFRLKQWIEDMCALPINFGMTSHPWRFEDYVSGEDMIMPWIQGRNMPQVVCGMMNVIGYGALDSEGVRLLHTAPQNGYYARDKFKALGPGMKNPSIKSIEDRIHKKVKEVASQRTSATPVKAAAKKAVAPVKKAGPIRPTPRKAR